MWDPYVGRNYTGPTIRGRRSRGPATVRRQHTVQRRTPISGEMGGTQTETTVTTEEPRTERPARRRSNTLSRQFSPTKAGSSVASVGLLEAEFFGSLFLLILIMFANTDTSYSDKIMSLIKRGSLLCLLFFLLAIIAGIGPNASKIAKAIGALVFVATLLTTPAQTVITDIDTLIKADWPGSTEHGQDVGSADTGTQSGSSGSSGSGILGAAEGAIERITTILKDLGGIL